MVAITITVQVMQLQQWPRGLHRLTIELARYGIPLHSKLTPPNKRFDEHRQTFTPSWCEVYLKQAVTWSN